MRALRSVQWPTSAATRRSFSRAVRRVSRRTSTERWTTTRAARTQPVLQIPQVLPVHTRPELAEARRRQARRARCQVAADSQSGVCSASPPGAGRGTGPTQSQPASAKLPSAAWSGASFSSGSARDRHLGLGEYRAEISTSPAGPPPPSLPAPRPRSHIALTCPPSNLHVRHPRPSKYWARRLLSRYTRERNFTIHGLRTSLCLPGIGNGR